MWSWLLFFWPSCWVSTHRLSSSKWLARGGWRFRCVHFCALHSQCLPKTVEEIERGTHTCRASKLGPVERWWTQDSRESQSKTPPESLEDTSTGLINTHTSTGLIKQSNTHTFTISTGMATTRHRSLVAGRKKGFVRDLAHTHKKKMTGKTDTHESKEKIRAHRASSEATGLFLTE